jgi:acyl-homoserine-lactone acylase
MQRLFGKTEVPWGQANVTIRGGTFLMDGTGLCDVLHPDEGPEQSNGQIFDNDGWGHLMIVTEGEPTEIWSLLPYGESEDPSSPHYNDQTKLHSRHEIKQFWFTPQQIRDYTESVWATVVALADIFDCGRPAGPKHQWRQLDGLHGFGRTIR